MHIYAHWPNVVGKICLLFLSYALLANTSTAFATVHESFVGTARFVPPRRVPLFDNGASTFSARVGLENLSATKVEIWTACSGGRRMFVGQIISRDRKIVRNIPYGCLVFRVSMGAVSTTQQYACARVFYPIGIDNIAVRILNRGSVNTITMANTQGQNIRTAVGGQLVTFTFTGNNIASGNIIAGGSPRVFDNGSLPFQSPALVGAPTAQRIRFRARIVGRCGTPRIHASYLVDGLAPLGLAQNGRNRYQQSRNGRPLDIRITQPCSTPRPTPPKMITFCKPLATGAPNPRCQ